MILAAATKVCRRGAIALAAVCAACSGTSNTYQPAALTAEQKAKCKTAEAAYRAGSDDYPGLRAELAADPTTACWLTRMVIHDLLTVREGRPLGEDQDLMRAAAHITNPVEKRALAEIDALGAVAVPTLVGDLLLHHQPQPRELGIELLARVGAPALPAVQEVARTGEPRQRRAAARTMGVIGVDATVLAILAQMANDEDYTVRADALRSLRSGGDEAQRLLVEKLRADPDPFVRRVAAQTLAYHPGQASSLALVDYLERCERERDFPGEKAAQASLQRLTASRGFQTPAQWRVTLRNPDEVGGKR
jgi:hypothetical protein